MPKVRWGIGREVVDDFDRESQYVPYAGPIPPNGVYRWTIKKLQHVAGTSGKHPQLRIGLEFLPRTDDEDQYVTVDKNGVEHPYFTMAFIPVMDKTAFRYVPFLDAIGVSAVDFTDRTLTDEEGNIKRIGQWKFTGEETIMAQLKDGTDDKGQSRKEVGVFLADVEDAEEDDEDAYDDEEIDDEDDLMDGDEEYDDEELEEEEPEPTPPPRKRAAKTTAPVRRSRDAF